MNAFFHGSEAVGGQQGRVDADAQRNAAVFDLAEGIPAIQADVGTQPDPLLVGRYCGNHVELTLAASGVAALCRAGDCVHTPWRVDGEQVVVDEEAILDIHEVGGRIALDGPLHLTDLLAGGCK